MIWQLTERLAECLRTIPELARVHQLPPATAITPDMLPCCYIAPGALVGALPSGQAGSQLVVRNYRLVFFAASLASHFGLDSDDEGLATAKTALNLLDSVSRYFLDNPRLSVGNEAQGVVSKPAYRLLAGDVQYSDQGLEVLDYGEESYVGFTVTLTVSLRDLVTQVS